MRTRTVDPGSQLLSDLVFVRTYSEKLADGRKERVEETINRVRDMHTAKFPHLTQEITAAFELVHRRMVVPSMRSMQFAGYAIQRSNVRIYNCFARETQFVTSQGIRSFLDFVDGEKIVVRGYRGWHPATVRNFGKDRLYKLTMRRRNREEVIYTTANHRWIVTDSVRQQIATTSELVSGLRLLSSHRGNRGTGLELCPIAIQHGVVFGDGTYDLRQNECRIRLCGEKKELRHLFSTERRDRATITGLPSNWKELPPLSMNKQYLLGFLAGWFAADGSIGLSGSNVSLCSSNYADLAWAKSALALLNIFTDKIGLSRSINPFNGAPAESWKLTINTDDVFEEFFLRSKHRDRFKGCERSFWTVVSVEPSDRFEDVWCVEEPVHQEFVLANGVVTKNCAYTPIENFKDIADSAFISMNGAGVGFSVQRRHVDQLPVVEQHDTDKVVIVDDTKEAWADSILALLQNPGTQFDYGLIRPKGSPLSTGGTASGPDSLRQLHDVVRKILVQAIGRRLRPIEVHDIMCHMGDLVYCGGVRRTALISLFDLDDQDMMAAKTGEWWVENPQRARANNSAVVDRQSPNVTDDIAKVLISCFQNNTGEPGLFLTDDPDWGANPCVEIALRPRQFCNLTEINASLCTTKEDFLAAAEAATIIGTLQASYTDFDYIDPRWAENCRAEALLGVSITGQAEAQHILTPENLREAAALTKRVNEQWAGYLGIEVAARIGCTKPSGSTSAWLTTTSGVHGAHSDFYLRRVRVDKEANWPIVQYLTDWFGISEPETGGVVERDLYSDDVVVVTIPISNKGAIKRDDESAVELMTRAKVIYDNWIVPSHRSGANHHNVSLTVSYKPEERLAVADWILTNRQSFTGVSLLPFDGGTYKQMPFEQITEEQYGEWAARFPKGLDLFSLDYSSTADLRKGEAACAGGQCEIY